MSSSSRDGTALPLLLLAGFQALVDDAHAWLADHGHPGARPVDGFALQAIGDGATTADLGRRLGVTKQAAAKTVAALEARDYVQRTADAHDARRVVISPTARGRELLTLSARAFAIGRARWVAEVGERRVAALERDLAAVVPAPTRLDAPSWFSR